MAGIAFLPGSTQDSIVELLKILYPRGVCDPTLLEDMELASEEGRAGFPDIGTKTVRLSTFRYLIENMFWINVCLFVNQDFRDCFADAVLIEKALLQVNDMEYEDFRADMTLASRDPAEDAKLLGVAIDRPSARFGELMASTLRKSKDRFNADGMTGAYEELAESFTAEERDAVKAAAEALVYVVNAMNRNGVFDKYVRLVVDSVKKQLGAH